MSMKKDHDFSCVAAATAILGDKWTPLIIQTLSESPGRFCHIQDSIGGINPRTLSARLTKLETLQIIAKQPCPSTVSRIEYALTDRGRDLVPIIHSMSVWGNKYAPSEV